MIVSMYKLKNTKRLLLEIIYETGISKSNINLINEIIKKLKKIGLIKPQKF